MNECINRIKNKQTNKTNTKSTALLLEIKETD